MKGSGEFEQMARVCRNFDEMKECLIKIAQRLDELIREL